MIKKLIKFIKRFSDLTVLLPVSAVLFATAYSWLRWIDPTAQILEVGVLSILLFNVVNWVAVFGGSYFIYNLYFYDYFKAGWEKYHDKREALIAHLVLWLSTVGLSAFILLRNL